MIDLSGIAKYFPGQDRLHPEYTVLQDSEFEAIKKLGLFYLN